MASDSRARPHSRVRSARPVQCGKNSSFFTRRPGDWSLANYLAFRHHPYPEPRRILNSWRLALQNIATCESKCHTDAQRIRASNLLARFDEKGAGSDRLFGRTWLQSQKQTQTPETMTPSTPPTQIAFAPVFNMSVSGAPTVINNGVTSSGEGAESLSTLANKLDGDGTGDDTGEGEGDSDEGDWDADADEDGVEDGVEDGGDDGDEYHDEDSDHKGNSDRDDGDSDNHNGYDSIPLPPTTSPALEALTSTYNHQTCRWSLSSGRCVETILYENCCLMDPVIFAVSLAPSFTVDLDDPIVRKWFYPEERKEIRESVPPMPMFTPGILAMFKSLRRFETCKTPAEVRVVLDTTSYSDQGQPYVCERDFFCMWSDLVIRNLFALWDSPSHPLRSSQLEEFYSNFIWAPILDQCFLSLPFTTIIRGESTCRSTASRKNRARTLGTRMRRGRRLDGVIRSIEDSTHEFGGIEVARTAAGGVKSTKWLTDAEKLLKALRDMLGLLCGLVGWKKDSTKRLQVVGVVCAGLKMQVIRMGRWREGGVAVVSRENIVGVPVGVEELTELSKLLIMVASTKVVVEEAVQAVRERHAHLATDVGKSDEQLLREMMSEVHEEHLGWAADTPPPDSPSS